MLNADSNSMYRGSKLLGLFAAFFLALVLSACGFQLRGMADLSFKSINIQGGNLSLKKDLIKQLKINGVQVLDSTEGAELVLELINERSEKRILSLSGGGLVREYELNYQLSFRTRFANDPTWSQVQTLQARRDFSYNDTAILGKAEEEANLNLDMRKDVTRELMRRLTAVHQTAQQ